MSVDGAPSPAVLTATTTPVRTGGLHLLASCVNNTAITFCGVTKTKGELRYSLTRSAAGCLECLAANPAGRRRRHPSTDEALLPPPPIEKNYAQAS